MLDQRPHEPEEERQQQRPDMGAVDIRIGHDDDFVIAKLRDIKVISVPLGKTAAESIDHGLDLRICKYFVNACFLHI